MLVACRSRPQVEKVILNARQALRCRPSYTLGDGYWYTADVPNVTRLFLPVLLRSWRYGRRVQQLSD